MKKNIQIELTKEQFSRLQYMQSIYMQLLTKFKFQIPEFAKAQEKAKEMDVFLMELRMKFDRDDDSRRIKMINYSNINTKEQADKIAKEMIDNGNTS